MTVADSDDTPENSDNEKEQHTIFQRKQAPHDSHHSSSPTQKYQLILETFMRVSLAGFGGALTGMALSKQQQRDHLRGGAATMRLIRRLDTNLSASWAMACMLFAGIIETCRWTSLTSYILPDSPAAQTIGDYTLGGAVAGAAFRGMQIQPSHIRKTRAPALTPRILSGLVPGVTLGFLAGVSVYAANVGLDMLEQYEQDKNDSTVQEIIQVQEGDGRPRSDKAESESST